MGRHLIQIDWIAFDKLCGIQATLEEIASWFDCSDTTIERAVKREKKQGFEDYYAQKAGKGKISLRRKQWELAMKGDKTMLVWLGKQYLGQNERMQMMLSKIPDEVLAEEGLRRLNEHGPQKDIHTVQRVADSGRI
jgi:IS30 family transposase